MLAKKKTLGELCKGLTIYPQVLKNVRVKSKPDAQNDPAVQAAVASVTEKLGDTGRILVRESGTEPVVRVMVEAETEECCRRLAERVVEVIRQNGHAV
jgi:phosphoglucosamine mutase